MKKSFTKISLFLSIVFFVFSFAISFFLYKIVDTNHKEFWVKDEEWKTEAKKRDEIKALERSVKIIQTEQTQLESHFAKSSDIVPFLDTIEALAPLVGAKAEVDSVDILDDGTGLMIGMKASGTFSSLYKFLTLLENSPYELKFVVMNINRETSMDVRGLGAATKWEAVFRMKLLSFID